MARQEIVKYTCDVCGKVRDGSKHIGGNQGPDSPPTLVRPPGWGSLHIMGMAGTDRRKVKADFCSEACLNAAVDEFVAALYGEHVDA